MVRLPGKQKYKRRDGRLAGPARTNHRHESRPLLLPLYGQLSSNEQWGGGGSLFLFFSDVFPSIIISDRNQPQEAPYARFYDFFFVLVLKSPIHFVLFFYWLKSFSPCSLIHNDDGCHCADIYGIYTVRRLCTVVQFMGVYNALKSACFPFFFFLLR